MTKSGGQFALASFTPISGGLVIRDLRPCKRVIRHSRYRKQYRWRWTGRM